MALQILIDEAKVITSGPVYLAQSVIHYNDGVQDIGSFSVESDLKIHQKDYEKDPIASKENLMIDLKNQLKSHMVAFSSQLVKDAETKADVEAKLIADGINVGGK